MYKHITVFLSALLCCASVFAQSAVEVGGRVSDENGRPMMGVNVVDVADLRHGTTTDIDGYYKIKVAATSSLQFSFLGYATLTVRVDNRTVVDVKMRPDDTVIDEVVVVGYGTYTKSGITGAVSNVDMDDLRSSATASVDQALQGRIAGMEITTDTGEPGSGSTIRIRGSRSVEAGNEPLIVVDGVLDAVSDLSEINPSDIVSISVLRDASSTAIYGARGANGVIIVTTDARQAHKLSVKLKADIGFSQLAGKLDIMNATEYAVYRNDMYWWMSSLSGRPQQEGSSYAFDDPSVYGKGTDWVKAIGRTALYQNYSLSLRGSTSGTNYYVGLGYNNSQGIVIGSGSERYAARFNIESKIARWLSLGVKSSYTMRDIDRNNAAIGGANTSAAIFLVPMLNTSDTWNRYGDESKTGGSVFNNPYLSARNIDNIQRSSNMNVTPFVKVYFTPYLQAESKLSFVHNRDRYYYYSPSYLPVAQTLQTGGTARRIDRDGDNLLSETVLSYGRTFARKHKLDLLAGFTAERRRVDYDYVSGTGFLNDKIGYNNIRGITDSRNLTTDSYNLNLQRMSVIARANYVYDERFHFTFTMRADGCSVFADGHKWGFFPAGAFRWSISKEKWLRGTYWLNDLSLRASVGRSGNDAISSYLSLPVLAASTSGWLFGDVQALSVYPTRLGNSDLTWETTDAYNIGIDFAVLKRRIFLEVDTYGSITTGMLLSVKNSHTTGYDTYFTNFGKTRNIGIEAALTTRNIVAPKFRWVTKLTIAHNNQKTIDVGNNGRLVPTYTSPRNSTQPLYGYRNGYPTNALWGYKYAGVWKNREEIAANSKTKTYVSASITQEGYARYVDINHDGVLDVDDYVYLGTSDPIVYGGFQNTFVLFDNLRLGIYFTYSLGGRIYNLSELWMGTGCSSSNKYRYMLDAWHPVRNPASDIPRAYTDDGVQASDRFVHDASYLRLQTLSLNYTWRIGNKQAPIKSVDFGVSCDNVWLWKRYNGFDPDVSTSAAARRVDNGAYPKARSFIFSIQLTY